MTPSPRILTPGKAGDVARNEQVLGVPAHRIDEYLAYLLIVVTLWVYADVTGFDFVNYDDNTYVFLNAQVATGLTWSNVKWAFTALHGNTSYWHPLTWLSHMAVCEFWGSNPGPQHAVNLVIHALNALAVYFLLRNSTGSRRRGALVAALFAWHPLHVESVAWISERKDVLSTLFMLLSLMAHVSYAKTGRRGAYWTCFALFAMALMSKPMAVTLPAALLLLDWWPLRRLTRLPLLDPQPTETGTASVAVDSSAACQPNLPSRPRPAVSLLELVYEKVPFLLLSIFVSGLTIVAQRDVGAMVPSERLPLASRLMNASVSYVAYIRKMFWPNDLCIFYPYENSRSLLPVIVCLGILALVTFHSLRARHTAPYLLFGWLWYILLLLPVIGLIQVGAQAMADRYTYLPLLGIFVMLAWGIPRRWPELTAARLRPAVALGVGATLALCCLASSRQVSVWRDTLSLFSHALSVTTNNPIAASQVAESLLAEGRNAEAHALLRRLNQQSSQDPDLLSAFGVACARLGNTAEATRALYSAIQRDPSLPTPYLELARILSHPTNSQANPREAMRLAILGTACPRAPRALGYFVLAQASDGAKKPEDAAHFLRLAVAQALRDRDSVTASGILRWLESNAAYRKALPAPTNSVAARGVAVGQPDLVAVRGSP